MPGHSVRRLVVLRLVALAALVGLATAGCDDGGGGAATTTSSSSTGAPSTTTTVPCRAGGRTIEMEGVEVREFCGPARAEVTVGDQTLEFTPGDCSRHDDWFAANLGVEVIEPDAGDGLGRPRFRSFSLLMGRHPGAADDALPVSGDGTYQTGSLSFAVPGTSWFVADKTITLLGSRTAGTIVGSAVASGPPAAGGEGEGGEVDQAHVDLTGAFTCDDDAVPLDEVADLMETQTTQDTDSTDSTDSTNGEASSRES